MDNCGPSHRQPESPPIVTFPLPTCLPWSSGHLIDSSIPRCPCVKVCFRGTEQATRFHEDEEPPEEEAHATDESTDRDTLVVNIGDKVVGRDGATYIAENDGWTRVEGEGLDKSDESDEPADDLYEEVELE